MTSTSHLIAEPLPTSEQVAEMQRFLGELDGLKSKLESKKKEAQKVIRSKMKDLHSLIDKWETRFLDTMAETLDEKIEGIGKQHEKLKSTLDWILDQSKTKKRMSRVFPSAMIASNAEPAANEADTEEGLQKAMDDDADDMEEQADKPEEELVKKHWRVWKALKFPLQPNGVTVAEVDVDLWKEFGPILEETRKSLKRSMLFVGGIVRAYMRRGHKKDEWVAMVRRLEARVESPNPAFMDPAFDSSLGSFGGASSLSSQSSHSSSSSSSHSLANPSGASLSHLQSGGSLLHPTPTVASASMASLVLGNSSAYTTQQIPGSSAIISTIWMAISDIFKYRSVPSVKAPLSKQLNYMYSQYPSYVEFYLPQLANLLLCNKDFPLTEFLLECCKTEQHFALQTYFLISSMSQVGPAQWQKRCIKILKQLIKAIPIAPHTPSEDAHGSGKRSESPPLLIPSSSSEDNRTHKARHQSHGHHEPGKEHHRRNQHRTHPTQDKDSQTLGEISTKLTKSHRKESKEAGTDTGATAQQTTEKKAAGQEKDASDDVLAEFPLELPTDSHNLMLLFSPRGRATMPIPGKREASGPLGATKSGTTPIVFPSLEDHTEATQTLSKSVPGTQSSFLEAKKTASETANGEASEPLQPSLAPHITISTSSSLKRSSETKKERSKSTTEKTTSTTLSSPPSLTPIAEQPSANPVELSGSAAIPIPTKPSYKTPPEHLYSLSPLNSPLISGTPLDHHDTLVNDLTREIKMAVTAAAEAVAQETALILPPAPVASVNSSSVVSSTPVSGSSASSACGTSNSSSGDTTHLEIPAPKSGEQEAYNSDDPEQELQKLTRITKPPSAPRVEKNLEVPAGKEYFFTQIKFMRKLIDVSRKLGELYGKPELYKPQLDRELEALSMYIDSGFAYMPTSSGVRTRVLRFALSDCHPIPTYGRVLYKMIMEVVDLPAHYTKEMADEYVRLNKDFKSMALESGEHEHGHHEHVHRHGESSSTGHGGKAEKDEDSSGTSSGASPKPLASPSKTHSSPASKKRKEGGASERRMLRSSASLPSISLPSSSSSAFGDSWKDVRRRLKAHSQYSSLPHWEVRAYIVKHGDLVLQEQFVMQLLVQFQHIWNLEGLPLKLNCYNIMATSYQSGLIEVVPNSISLDKLKKVTEASGDSSIGASPLSLYEFFKKQWPTSEEFKRARGNFVASLAAYSVVCYLLQIKDRHNGNIMLDAEGHIFHIDFGYLLARTIKFERAPFKLTDEFIEVLGGDQSKSFRAYCNLCVLGFLAVRKHYEKIQLMVEMSSGQGAAIPCLEGDSVAPNLKKRFHLDWSDQQCESYILGLIGDARDNWRTQIYDTYQRIVNNIH